MNPASPLSLESTVGGYRLLRTLGEGEVATVHEAEHALLPRRAALKVLRPEVVGSPQAAQRILREGCVLEALAHPGVARVFDAGVLADGRPWLALELIGGESLASVLERAGALAPDAVVELAIALADVLAAAHRAGIVHRALGARRVMIGASAVRILGWGLARQPGASLELAVDRRNDVYALGSMLYQAATGQPPFVAMSPVDRVMSQFHAPAAPVASLRPELPAGVGEIIDRMVCPEPTARPSAPEVAVALSSLVRPYDGYELVADGTDPGGEPALVAAGPASEADRDWEQLMALAVGRHRWSGTGNAAAARNDGRAPSPRGK